MMPRATPPKATPKSKSSFLKLRDCILALQEKKLASVPGPASEKQIKEIEKTYEILLPEDYRQFLSQFGAFYSEEISVAGIDPTPGDRLTLEQAFLILRLASLDPPIDLLPLEVVSETEFVCLVCDGQKRKKSSRVAICKLIEKPPYNKIVERQDSFFDYVYDRISRIRETLPTQPDAEWDRKWAVFEQHVAQYQKKFDYEHAKGGKLPRNTDWRPYRFCIQDVVFGVTVVRHNSEGNCLQLDVFLTADVPEYGPLAGARALAAFILSEAYKCGGSMEMRFTKNSGGKVPRELQELAKELGVKLAFVLEGRISADEAKALFAGLTNLSPELTEEIRKLEKKGRIKLPRACYVIHHGIWNREQLEMFILGSENPASLLGGDAVPEQRHLYQHDLLHSRAAIMADLFERTLLQRHRQDEEGIGYDMEDDTRAVEISFDGAAYMKQYRSPEEIELGWLLGGKKNHAVKENIPFQVLIRARDAADLHAHLQRDLQAAEKLRLANRMTTFILIPYDLYNLPEQWIAKTQEMAQAAKVGLLICPEITDTLDAEAGQKLANSRIVRK